jgi:hypothetical protein
VGKNNNSLTGKHDDSEKKIARDREKNEQIRELEDLQRGLAERIRSMERVAKQAQKKEPE